MAVRLLALFAALAALPAAAEEAAAPAAEVPQYAVKGWTSTRAASPGCVERTIRAPFFRGRVFAKFAVRPDGRVTDFTLLGAAPADVAQAVETAVRSCAWVPGTDENGKPWTTWVTLPLRFEGERRPTRNPREATPGCARARLDALGLSREYLVVIDVTSEGQPEQFLVKPDDIPSPTKAAIIAAVSSCAWRPAADEDGKPVAGRTLVSVEEKP